MKRHAALPDGEDLERMGRVVPRLVEQHVAQPAAEDHAEHGEENEVVELLARDRRAGLSRMRRRPSHQAAAKPARYMRPYQRTASGPIGERDRIEVRVNEHDRLRAAAGVRDEVARRGRACAARAMRATGRAADAGRRARGRPRRGGRGWPPRPGTIAAPSPLDTRLTTVCIWIASCATLSGDAGPRGQPARRYRTGPARSGAAP